MFKVGQKWENPEGLVCEITHITSGKIVYKTPDDVGFQSIERWKAWVDSGSVELIKGVEL